MLEHDSLGLAGTSGCVHHPGGVIRVNLRTNELLMRRKRRNRKSVEQGRVDLDELGPDAG